MRLVSIAQNSFGHFGALSAAFGILGRAGLDL